MPDTLWYPTAYARSLVAGLWNGHADAINDYRERQVAGITTDLVHPFEPTLLLMLESTAPVPFGGAAIPIPVRLDWEFDVVVRGLRKAHN